jgi:hypothetical protein|tara:strand:+ start:24 stop:248 length:225 start_codon:yes stop_codon:yes gene_type:complete
MKKFKQYLKEIEEVEVDEDNKDALKKALALHKFKQKGGKIDKQPDSLERPYGNLSKDDLKRAKKIVQYKKDKKE